MKKYLLFVTTLCLSLTQWLTAQTTLTIKPLPADTTDTQINWTLDPANDDENKNLSHGTILHSGVWTHNGQLKLNRSLLKFTLENLPTEATISNATLYLYGNSNPVANNDEHLYDNSYFPNEAWLSRITESWNPKTVTWNTQPMRTAQNQITLATSTSHDQNYEVDVTALLIDALSDQQDSLGVMIEIKDSINYYTSMVFHSCKSTDEALRPTLVIEYTTSVSTQELAKQVNFQLYPNPGTEDLNINLELANKEDVKINIADITGKTVYSSTHNGVSSLQENISLRENSAGIYIVSIRHGKKVITKKWVMQK